MPRPIKSIRWRFVIWLAFLLTIVLAGFGVTAYQLHSNNQFNQLDEELKSRTAVLSAVLRTPPMQIGRGPRGFGPGDRMTPGDKDREPPRRDNFGGRTWSQTNSPSRLERPFADEPPRRPPDDEPPGRPWELDKPEDYFAKKIRQSAEVARQFDEAAINGFYYVTWIRAFGASASSPSTNAPASIPLPDRTGFDTGTHTRTRGNFREAWHYTEMGDCVLAGKSVEAELLATRKFAAWLVLGGLGVLTLGVAGIWIIAGRTLRPVHEISAAATRISAGNLSERINASTTDDELGELAATLNSTFARLETAFNQQQQFTADASHELRTPLAVMISETQTTLARPRSEAEYKETIETCLATAQQMRKLTESLLELARYDSGQENLQRAPFDLAELARDSANLLRPLGTERGVKFEINLVAAPAVGDADRIRQVVINLVSNAIFYNKPGGQVRLTTHRASDDRIALVVEDDGIGIAAEELPNVFKRFYRADKSRSRSDGRSGLGLAICKAIVDAHGGEITVTSTPGKGTSFTVKLPTAT